MEERGYEKRLPESMETYCAGEADVSKVRARLVCFARPFGTHFWITNFGSEKTPQIEVQMRTSKRLPVFACWQGGKLYAILPRQCCSAYISVRSRWAYWKPGRILCVPLPVTFSYLTN